MEDKTPGSWLWPLFFTICFGIAALYADLVMRLSPWLIAMLVVAGGVLLAGAIANFVQYAREQESYWFHNRQMDMAITPDGEMFRNAKDLAAQSPELAGEVAKRMGRPDLILFPTRQGKQAQIRLSGSQVTLQFALYVLSMSDEKSMMAQRKVSDGTYLFDPNREITDRAQWVELNHLWARESIVTRYIPNLPTNQPPMWLRPWTPERILENWLLTQDMLDTLRPYFLDEEKVDQNQAEPQEVAG